MVTTVTDNSPQSINTSLFSLDKEVQEIKKVTDTFNDTLSGINTESGVISVNGKQGIVELTASDVDALPSSTIIPTTTSELENTSGFITSSDSITGNAATADKVKNALTINGKTYDGSSAVDAGVQTVANGGTGVTTQAEINRAFIGNLDTGESDVTDGTEFVSSCAADNGFTNPGGLNTPYKRKFSTVWNYIKGKISSVLGLTKDNYGGKASTAGTADVAKALSNRGYITKTDTFQNVMNNDGKWVITDLVGDWYGSLYSFHAGGSQSGLMFRIRGGSHDIRNIEVNYSIDSRKFAGSWHPLIGRIPTSAPSSPKDGDIWIE